MEGYGTILAYFIIAIICFSLYFVIKNRNNKKIISIYNNSLKLVDDAKCVLICRYLEGIDDLVTNASCYLLSDEEKLTIIPLEYTNTKITLSLSKIKSFQYTYKVITNVTPIRPRSEKYITILYLSNSDDLNEIIFSTVLSAEEDLFDKYALSKCNLYTFINERIPKQETIIEL